MPLGKGKRRNIEIIISSFFFSKQIDKSYKRRETNKLNMDPKINSHSIKRINGHGIHPVKLKEMILSTKRPFVLQNCIESWEAMKWSLAEFTELFGKIKTRFKLHRKKTNKITDSRCYGDGTQYKDDSNEPTKKMKRFETCDRVPMETECVYQDGTFADFKDWLNGSSGDNRSALFDYPRYLSLKYRSNF